MRRIDVRGFAVMKEPCATCPFVTNTLGEGVQPYVENIVGLMGQHTCHSVGDTKICRGGRDLMLRVMASQGLIDAATDEAFERRSKEALGDRYVEPGTRPRKKRRR
jgi:hypothetical protein